VTSVAAKRDYLRIGELADRAGVSVATIKFYIREGLLPPPPVKTGRTMGYYDEAYLERLLLIRRLREEHFLPLRAIRLLLEDRGDRPLSGDEAALLERIGPQVVQRLDQPAAPAAASDEAAPVDRAAVLARWGLRADELELLIEMGLVGGDDGKTFSAADQELFDALNGLEKAGLTRERFPIEGLAHYVELLGELARREVRHFSHFAAAAHVPGEELARMSALATDVSTPIVTLIRRKLILRALRAELAHSTPVTAKPDPKKSE
jgi:DNA-binding transcriptional MerR regulator